MKKICIYTGASDSIDKKYIDVFSQIGKYFKKHNYGLIFGGGSSGLMGTVSSSCIKNNVETIGVITENLKSIEKPSPNLTKLVIFDNMQERKKYLFENSDISLVAPGGIGTYDEFFEILCLKKLGELNNKIIIFNLYGYFDPLINLIKHGINNYSMEKEDFELFEICTNLDEFENLIT